MKNFLLILLVLLLPAGISAATPVDAYLFVSEGCVYCEQASYFLNNFKNTDIKIFLHQLEISHNSDNAALFQQFAQAYNSLAMNVPTIFIGDKIIAGYYPEKIQQQLLQCSTQKCPSPQQILNQYLKNEKTHDTADMPHKILWIIVFGISAAGIITLLITRNRARV